LSGRVAIDADSAGDFRAGTGSPNVGAEPVAAFWPTRPVFIGQLARCGFKANRHLSGRIPSLASSRGDEGGRTGMWTAALRPVKLELTEDLVEQVGDLLQRGGRPTAVEQVSHGAQ
jgi:hypothetical protein